MGKTKAEIRAAVMAAMEAEVDQLLAWEDETERVSMTDIEDQVIGVRQRLSAHLTEVLAQQRAQKADLEVPSTSDGRRLHYKGKKTKSAKRARGS
jgi:hypothetical protein